VAGAHHLLAQRKMRFLGRVAPRRSFRIRAVISRDKKLQHARILPTQRAGCPPGGPRRPAACKVRQAAGARLTPSEGPPGGPSGERVKERRARESVHSEQTDPLSGRSRRRSGDPTLFRRVLYQLSYPTAGGQVSRFRSGPGCDRSLRDGSKRLLSSWSPPMGKLIGPHRLAA
jgi:hypothetical protein